jgi:hypothetical protein
MGTRSFVNFLGAFGGIDRRTNDVLGGRLPTDVEEVDELPG